MSKLDPKLPGKGSLRVIVPGYIEEPKPIKLITAEVKVIEEPKIETSETPKRKSKNKE